MQHAADHRALQAAMTGKLLKPVYDLLQDDRDLAVDLFSQVTPDNLSSFLDCDTINSLWRKAQLLVHPDVNRGATNKAANMASTHLNIARETLGCRQQGTP